MPETARPYYVRLFPRAPKIAPPRIRRVTAPTPRAAMEAAERVSRAYTAVEVSLDNQFWFIPTEESA